MSKLTTKSIETEVLTGPDWTRAKEILGGIKLAIRYSIAGQVLLGFELLEIKKQLGFLGSGRRKEKPHVAVFEDRTTWEDWCKAELGISDDTANRFIDCFEAVRLSVKKLGGAPKLLAMFSTAPSKLTEEDRATMEKIVAKATDGQSQKDLLEELKLVKAPKSLTGGDTSGHGKDKTQLTSEQLSFIFFAPIVESMHKARSLPTYDEYLRALPLASDDEEAITLERLEREHRIALDDVRAAIKSRKA